MMAKLNGLLDAGVRRIVCLQEEHELGEGGRQFAPYAATWRELGLQRGLDVSWQRYPIRDMGIPSPQAMADILAALAPESGGVYVHCWGGHGRTGTVAGCYLVQQGMQVDAALGHIRTMRETDDYLRTQPSPQTAEQIAFIAAWFDAGPQFVIDSLGSE